MEAIIEVRLNIDELNQTEIIQMMFKKSQLPEPLWKKACLCDM